MNDLTPEHRADLERLRDRLNRDLKADEAKRLAEIREQERRVGFFPRRRGAAHQ